MNKTILIFLLLIFIGCDNPESSLEQFENIISIRWISAYQIKDLTKGLIGEKSEEIVRPPFAWIPLLEIGRWNKNGMERDCLFYRTPHKTENGILKLVVSKSGESCSEQLDISYAQPIAELENVQKLFLSLDGYGLDIKFNYLRKRVMWKIPFYNLEKKKAFKLYSSPLNGRLITGLTVLTSGENEKYSPRVGTLSDKYADQTATICHQVDNNCVSLSANTCDQCKYGYYSMANIHCPQGGTKICGVNHCGERLEPACPRGLEYKNYKMEYSCEDDSMAAFCNSGLRVMCDGKQNLICN